jgi:hypothetical protein
MFLKKYLRVSTKCILLLVLVVAISNNTLLGQQTSSIDNGKPFANFIMVHLEAGSDNNSNVYQNIIKQNLDSNASLSTRSLSLQKALWPSVVRLVNAANKYGHKLTIAMNPQWAEFILKSPLTINICRQWVVQGHELAFHHHGINHVDWNGYTNRGKAGKFSLNKMFMEKMQSGSYRGDVAKGFSIIEKLVNVVGQPNGIISGCITDTACDKPQKVRILTKGSKEFEKDFLNTPEKMMIGQQTLFWLNHFQLASNFNTSQNPQVYTFNESRILALEDLQRIKKAYRSASSRQTAGIVFHGFDYHRMPEVYENLFQWLASKRQISLTAREIVRQYFSIPVRSGHNQRNPAFGKKQRRQSLQTPGGKDFQKKRDPFANVNNEYKGKVIETKESAENPLEYFDY